MSLPLLPMLHTLPKQYTLHLSVVHVLCMKYSANRELPGEHGDHQIEWNVGETGDVEFHMPLPAQPSGLLLARPRLETV